MRRDMKKLFAIAAVLLAIFSSCKKINFPDDTLEGTLSFTSFTLAYDTEVLTKAVSKAPDTYAIIITDNNGAEVVSTTYGAIVADGGEIDLLAGNYTLTARSTASEVPASVFDEPVYGASEEFTIVAGETTEIGSLVCKLLQCKVTVDYDEEFLKCVTGDCQTDVTVTAGAPLAYKLGYNSGNFSIEDSAGYFAVNNGEKTTMNVVFKGSIEGKIQKMTAALTGIQPQQWRQIKFYKKIDEQGNALFEISITDFIDDEELSVEVSVVPEDVIGDDPERPIGDGGITLEFADDCTMFTDLMNIVVPEKTTKMDLRVLATVPNGVRKFYVDISSTSDTFIGAVNAAGGTRLDLVNPSQESEIVFQIVPFTHGADLVGKTSIPFDLSNAQEAILGFEGEHTFTMDVTDQLGCNKKLTVKMIVKKVEE